MNRLIAFGLLFLLLISVLSVSAFNHLHVEVDILVNTAENKGFPANGKIEPPMMEPEADFDEATAQPGNSPRGNRRTRKLPSSNLPINNNPESPKWVPSRYTKYEIEKLENLRQQQVKALALGETPAGYYRNRLIETEKTQYPCPTGTRANKYQGCGAIPLPCPPGTYTYKSDDFACIPCDLGTYTQYKAQTGCRKCETGYFTSEKGQSKCIPIPIPDIDEVRPKPSPNPSNPTSPRIWVPVPGMFHTPQDLQRLREEQGKALALGETPAGYYRNRLIETEKTQYPCPAGTRANKYQGCGAIPLPCPPGTYTYKNNEHSCIPCSLDTYNQQNGQTSCSDCGVGFITATKGATQCIAR